MNELRNEGKRIFRAYGRQAISNSNWMDYYLIYELRGY